MTHRNATLLREYGPFPGVDRVHGVSFDGHAVWFACDDRLHALDPDSGQITRTLDVPADAGTAFDGRHLYQIGGGQIRKIDARSGAVLATLAAPCGDDCSGLAWAEGMLWVGQYRGRRIHQLDPDTGAVLRTLESERFVTGVTWVAGQLWHGTWQDEQSDLRRVDPESGVVLERIAMPAGSGVSGLEADAGERFYCGGGDSGTVRAIRR